MPLDLPVIPDATVLRSTTTTSVTPRWLSAQAVAAPSMPPPTMMTSAVIIRALCSSRKRSSVLSALRASAHRCSLLFAQALIGALCSSRKRSSRMIHCLQGGVGLDGPAEHGDAAERLADRGPAVEYLGEADSGDAEGFAQVERRHRATEIGG